MQNSEGMNRKINWKDRPVMAKLNGNTMGELYDPAMKITDQVEANRYLEALVHRCMDDGKSREESESIQKSNLAYYAGYYDHETRLRVEQLFNCSHPIFGPAVNGEPTPEEAFKMGMELGEKIKKGVKV
jgi:hypothetical protein